MPHKASSIKCDLIYFFQVEAINSKSFVEAAIYAVPCMPYRTKPHYIPLGYLFFFLFLEVTNDSYLRNRFYQSCKNRLVAKKSHKVENLRRRRKRAKESKPTWKVESRNQLIIYLRNINVPINIQLRQLLHTTCSIKCCK